MRDCGEIMDTLTDGASSFVVQGVVVGRHQGGVIVGISQGMDSRQQSICAVG